MKLGELKSKMRAMKGNPSVPLVINGGTVIWVKVQKTDMMKALDEVLSNKASETGLHINGERIGPSSSVAAKVAATPSPAPVDEEGDDLLDDEEADLLADGDDLLLDSSESNTSSEDDVEDLLA
jgi:hypothetical protein